MLKITTEIELYQFRAWGGAKSRLDEIIRLGIEKEMEQYIIEYYGDRLTDGDLNDILWFEMDDAIEEYSDEKKEEY